MYHVLPQILSIYSSLCLEKSYFLCTLNPLDSLRFISDISSRKSFQILPSVSNIYLYWDSFGNMYSETQLILTYSKQIIIVKVLGCFKDPSKGMQINLENDNEGLNTLRIFSPLSPPPVPESSYIFSLLLAFCLFSSLCVCFILLLCRFTSFFPSLFHMMEKYHCQLLNIVPYIIQRPEERLICLS